MNAATIPEYPEAINFLQTLRAAPWALTAISPTGEITTITAQDTNAARAFVHRWIGKRNLYYSVNPTRTALNSKAAKTDIAAVEFLLADLDPREGESPVAAKARYLTSLETHEPTPTAIVDSGNGIQALWRLDKPIKLAEPVILKNAKGDLKKAFPPETGVVIADVEAQVAAQMERLGSVAGTQNIDRIMRLPGTVNLPNKKKLKAGRVACPTKLIKFTGETCTLGDFPSPKRNDDHAEAGESIGIEALPISERIKNLIRGRDDPEHPYASRSEAVFAVLLAMVSAGCSDYQIAAVILDLNYPISAHVLEQANPQEYLTRQISKARKKTTDPDVAKVNESYALVIVGDKTAVLKTVGDGISFLTVSAFDQWQANKQVIRNDKKIALGKYWIAHPQRRQYEGITFDPSRCEVPNQFNLWRGFSVQPKSGDCSKFLAHVKDNVSRGDESLNRWVLGWLADIVQHPAKKIGTSLVLRGAQGVGKTKLGEVFGSLLGPHYSLVSDPRYVTGRFNSHLSSTLLLHCDESFWAGDHAAEGRLKDLVTGDHHFIEFKGKEAIRVRNYVRLLVCGNQNWLVPAGFGERRFATLDVGEDHKQDHSYFAAIDAEMESGGREALLDFLMHFDLKSVNLRTIPHTAALLEQKLSSLDAEQGWWLDMLARGELPWGCVGHHFCPSKRLFDRYVMHAGRHGVRRRAIETQLGMFLNKHVPGLRRHIRGQYSTWTKTGRMKDTSGTTYEFPSLTACRRAFADALQQDFSWNEKEEWTHEPSPDADIDETVI